MVCNTQRCCFAATHTIFMHSPRLLLGGHQAVYATASSAVLSQCMQLLRSASEPHNPHAAPLLAVNATGQASIPQSSPRPRATQTKGKQQYH
jgi:hypothetical protein